MPALKDEGHAAKSGDAVVSIIVPGTGDEWHRRLANAREQTWPHCEIVPVETEDGPDFAAEIQASFKAAKGQYLSVLPAGTRYAPEKTERQMGFLERFELHDMALYCGHNLVARAGARRALRVPTPEPVSVFAALYRGLPVAFGSLIFPRRLVLEAKVLLGLHAEPALFDIMLRLAHDHSLIGMADVLLEARPPPAKMRFASEWRRVYAHHLQHYIGSAEARGADSCTGNAIADRMISGLPLAALDLFRAADPPGRTKATLRGLASRLPAPIKRAVPFRRHTRDASQAGTPRLDFDQIYTHNGFGGSESLSGTGSSLFQTRIVRRQLPGLLKEIGVTSILDVPCGDFNWMQHVDLSGVDYIGADIVAYLVAANQKRHARSGCTFQQVDLVRGPLPKVDLVLCRDCLVHLSLAEGTAALDTVLSTPAKWLLSTTFTKCAQNKELDASGWRPLNLELPPFNLPPPAHMLDEKCTEAGGTAGDKTLGLWNLADLRERLSIT